MSSFKRQNVILLFLCSGKGDITNVYHATGVANVIVAFYVSIMYIIFMATDKPRIMLTLTEELMEEIDDYRYENRIPARSEAIRQLIKEALTKYKKNKKETSVNEEQNL